MQARAQTWVAGLVGLLTLGCADLLPGLDDVPTWAGYEASIQAYEGGSVNEAIRALGAPTRTVPMAGGHTLYVWEERSESYTPLVGEQRYDAQTGSDRVVMSGHERIPLDCQTEIEADAAGIVVHTRVQGVACIGTGPTASPAAAAVAEPPPGLPDAPPPPPAPPPVPADEVAEEEVAEPADAPQAGTADESTAPVLDQGRRRPNIRGRKNRAQ